MQHLSIDLDIDLYYVVGGDTGIYKVKTNFENFWLGCIHLLLYIRLKGGLVDIIDTTYAASLLTIKITINKFCLFSYK